MKDAAFVVGVVELPAIRSDTAPSAEKNLTGHQHSHRRSNEVNPERLPVTGMQSWAEGSGRVSAHSRQWSFKSDIERDQSAGEIGLYRAPVWQRLVTTRIVIMRMKEIVSSAANAMPLPKTPGTVTA